MTSILIFPLHISAAVPQTLTGRADEACRATVTADGRSGAVLPDRRRGRVLTSGAWLPSMCSCAETRARCERRLWQASCANAHGCGVTVFQHACKIGAEGNRTLSRSKSMLLVRVPHEHRFNLGGSAWVRGVADTSRGLALLLPLTTPSHQGRDIRSEHSRGKMSHADRPS